MYFEAALTEEEEEEDSLITWDTGLARPEQLLTGLKYKYLLDHPNFFDEAFVALTDP